MQLGEILFVKRMDGVSGVTDLNRKGVLIQTNALDSPAVPANGSDQ
jgi:hypothetical protein